MLLSLCRVRFVPVDMTRTEFWTAYYHARQHRTEREADASQRPSADNRGSSRAPSALPGPLRASVASLKNAAEFFDAYKRGAYGSGTAHRALGGGAAAGTSNAQLVASAEAAGLGSVAGASGDSGGAGYGTREADAAYGIDARTMQAVAAPAAQRPEMYGRAAWAAGRVIDDANRYSTLVLNDAASPDVGSAITAAAAIPASADLAPEDLAEDLREGGDPAAGLATLSTDLSDLRAILAAGRATLEESKRAMEDSAAPGVAPLRRLPPAVDLCSARAVKAARESLGKHTRDAHDIFEARKRGSQGLPSSVPLQWREWVTAQFRTYQELLPHLWAALTSTTLDDPMRERRDRMLRRLAETHADLERIKRVVVEKGALGIAPPPLTASSWGGATQPQAFSDLDVQDVTGGPEAATAAKEELSRLISILQATLAPTIVQAEEARAGLPLRHARWKPE